MIHLKPLCTADAETWELERTPMWCRIFPEELAGPYLVHKFLSLCGTRRLITEFTITHHLSLSRARKIQFMSSHSNFWRSFAILHFHLRLVPPSGLFLSGCPPNPWTHLLSLPYENWNTFYWLWNEKRNVICINTIKNSRVKHYY